MFGLHQPDPVEICVVFLVSEGHNITVGPKYIHKARAEGIELKHLTTYVDIFDVTTHWYRQEPNDKATGNSP